MLYTLNSVKEFLRSPHFYIIYDLFVDVELQQVQIVISPALIDARGCSMVTILGVDTGSCDQLIITLTTLFNGALLPSQPVVIQFYDSEGDLRRTLH